MTYRSLKLSRSPALVAAVIATIAVVIAAIPVVVTIVAAAEEEAGPGSAVPPHRPVGTIRLKTPTPRKLLEDLEEHGLVDRHLLPNPKAAVDGEEEVDVADKVRRTLMDLSNL